MIALNIFVYGWPIVIIIFCSWWLICINKATKQKERLRYFESDLKQTVDLVSIDKHFWYLFTFRNPFRLYRQHLDPSSELKPINPDNWWS